METENRIIDANVVLAKKFTTGLSDASGNYYGNADVVFADDIENAPTVDAVEVVRCKECRFAKPYERMDGKTGYYCQFCGHSFKYGTNCDHFYNPIKNSDDFCSYGERKDGDGNG